jgi:hypothetical protein
MDALMEQLAGIISRLEAQTADTRQPTHRDALRDHPTPIVVDQPFLPPRPPLAPHSFPHGPARHPTMSAPSVGPAAR